MKQKNKSKKIVFDPEINEQEKSKVAVDQQIKKKTKKLKGKPSKNLISSSVVDVLQNTSGVVENKDVFESVTHVKNDELKRSKKQKNHMELQVEKKVKQDVTHQKDSLHDLSKSKTIAFHPKTNEQEKSKVDVDDQIKKKPKKKHSISSSVDKVVQNNSGIVENKEELENETPVKKDESIRSKKRKKHMDLEVEKKLKQDVTYQERSLNYLSKWKHSRNDWKFEKKRQVWLKHNMFDVDKVPEQFWDILIEYFSNAKGNIRKTMVNDALKVMEAHENGEDNSDDVIDRARAVIQCLQES